MYSNYGGSGLDHVLMPSMPRTLSTGLDFLKMSPQSQVPPSLTGSTNGASQAQSWGSGNGASNGAAQGGLALLSSAVPLGGVSNTNGNITMMAPVAAPASGSSVKHFLNSTEVSRTGTPVDLSALLGSPTMEIPQPAMTPNMFLADTPVPMTAAAAPLQFDRTEDAAALLQQFRSGVRTPTPNGSNMVKEENVFERNLAILNNAPSYESSDVAPLPRQLRQRTSSSSNVSARPSDLMMRDPSLPGMDIAGAMLPPLQGLGSSPGSLRKVAPKSGAKRKAPAKAAAARRGQHQQMMMAMEGAADEDDHGQFSESGDDSGADSDSGDDSGDEEGGVDGSGMPIPRKRKGQTEDDGVLAKKRKRRREKCRVAATRFRQKKREEMKQMEDTANLLEQENKDLVAEMTQLKQKIMDTKMFLLQHEKCLESTNAQQQQQQQQQ